MKPDMLRLMVATDGSSGANRAIDAAARLAKATGSELIILTVGGDISGSELRELASVQGDLSETLKSAAEDLLERAGNRARRHGAPSVTLRSAWGYPTEAIIDAVRRDKIDILVVGRRGRGRLSGLLLGSVSQKLTSLAPCSVMVVP